MSLLPPAENDDKLRAKPLTTRKLVVFSGGSAANSLVDVFEEVIDNNTCSLTYVIPISDNGGSSSELIRVFGGPGIGDVRSKESLAYPILRTVQYSITLSFSPVSCLVCCAPVGSTEYMIFLHPFFFLLVFYTTDLPHPHVWRRAIASQTLLPTG